LILYFNKSELIRLNSTTEYELKMIQSSLFEKIENLEYSMYACMIRLVDDYAIHYPIALCEPLNADFDGDCVAIQLVPEESAEDVYNKMSARYMNVYKKSNNPIFPFNHETLEYPLGVLKV